MSDLPNQIRDEAPLSLNSNGNADANGAGPKPEKLASGTRETLQHDSVVWIVDCYCDSVKKRTAERAVKEQMFGAGKLKRYEIFGSELQALQFMEQRAMDLAVAAETELALAKARHRKCNKKLNDFYVRSSQEQP